MKLQSILTEQRNSRTVDIDQLSTLEIVKVINEEDKLVPLAVEKSLPEVAKMIDYIVEAFQKGGRLIYAGAGTSGRLGILDASECPPTYGTDPEMVIGMIAGGEKAIQCALEGAEDDWKLGENDIDHLHISSNDVVVGIAASGRTPYTIAAMKRAKEKGAVIGAIVCSPNSEMEKEADITMLVESGPEVVTGSTRMKSGTAQKLVLNMLTTASMIRMGKVYSNLMIDVKPTNHKLRERAKLIVAEAADVSLEEAEKAIEEYGSTKPAILSLLTGIQGPRIISALENNKGHLKNALKELI